MKIGIDYWQVLSHYHKEFFNEFVAAMLTWDVQATQENEIHIVSAIGKARIGTIEKEVRALGFNRIPVHEVVFNDPKESPQLKLAKCKELGLTVFFDDRDDVCRLLTANGILALRVGRKDNSTYDLGAERS